ncbi:armadillo-type protein [Suillus placidus]|uniref:Armadillo-type protein n=1 Tax=Suillus placidus TaxID=48579 RepID=A0A9P7CYV4_9AGAM|nr:armadillo-type protein [Suillus placidus]
MKFVVLDGQRCANGAGQQSLSTTTNFFKTKPRTPPDIVRGLRDAIPKLESGPPGSETRRKAREEVSRNLQAIKGILYGDGDLLLLLVQNVARFDFEARKDVVQIFNNLLRHQIGARLPTVEYVCARHEDVIFVALEGYSNEEVALNVGMVLREMLRREQLAKILLYFQRFCTFPHHTDATHWQTSETLKRHQLTVAEYLDKNDDRAGIKFSYFSPLWQLSKNYVTEPQSLKLLREIHLDRANFSVATRYVAQESNLKMMNALRDKSKNIQEHAERVAKRALARFAISPRVLARQCGLRHFESSINDVDET